MKHATRLYCGHSMKYSCGDLFRSPVLPQVGGTIGSETHDKRCERFPQMRHQRHRQRRDNQSALSSRNT
jgi:hypothetical protein